MIPQRVKSYSPPAKPPSLTHFPVFWKSQERMLAMKQFKSIEKLDTAILYSLELASSLSVLLLAFGLIASMANVLTKGSVLSDNLIMQRIWAWTQCIAIDASVAGAIIRTFRYSQEKERLKFWLYALLSVLLLFTAAIVSDIESVQQTLSIALDSAYSHVFIPVELLIWIRSFVIVLLIVAHAIRHVSVNEDEVVQAEQAPVTVTPELVEAIRSVIVQEIQGEQTEQKALPAPDNYERVKEYLGEYPNAKVREVAQALSISLSTANKWMKVVGERANAE